MPNQHVRKSKQARSFPAAFLLVEVRIAAVRDQRGAVLHHRRGDVGVQIEREDNRHRRPHHFAQPPKKFSVGIRIWKTHGGAVQGDEQGIDRQILPQGIQQLADQPLVRIFR